jgi:hypothetical protein
MPITPQTLHQCLWALPDKTAEGALRRWQVPTVRTLFAKREHNFVPVFCLPASQPVPILRSRLALPRKYLGILRLPVIQVQLSFCAPLAVFGEATLQLSAQGYSFDFLKLPQVGAVNTPELVTVAQAVGAYLQSVSVELLTPAEAAYPLPENERAWNRKTNLDRLFMKDDYPY